MKSKKGISLIILVFAIIILLLVGYIVYDKFIASNNEPISNSDTNTNVTDKNEEVEDKEQVDQEKELEVVLDEKKNMITSDADKIAINTKLKENQQLVQLMLKNKLNNGEFSDDEKVGITNVIAMVVDKDNFQKNSQGENFENSVDKQYLKNYSLNIFEQPINYDNVTMYTITNDKITTYNPGGIGIAFYKVKSLYLNEKTKIYTLEVDVVSTNIMDHIEEYTKPETIQYDSNCVTSTFTLKYKEVEGKKLLISLEK